MQMTLFDQRAERKKRDAALDLLEEKRRVLIAMAKAAAMEIWSKHGRVTGPEVFALLVEWGNAETLAAVDPRFMGAVFRIGAGWKRAGYEPQGSHGRPVSIWTR